MPRRPRRGSGGLIFHVMNRASRRAPLFEVPDDYRLLVDVLAEGLARGGMRVLAYALMPNHWHLVLWPAGDRDLSTFMAWVTATHVRRWHLAHASVGTGALYQGRYKALAVKDDDHFLTVCRYVERNPVRAGLVTRAADWRWSSAGAPAEAGLPLSGWPVPRPTDWGARVDHPETTAELEALRQAIRRSRPCGPSAWVDDLAVRLTWRMGLRGVGRPLVRRAVGPDVPADVHADVAETEISPDPAVSDPVVR